MTGTIYSGTYVTGIVLSDPTTQLPATVTGSVSNQDGDAILGTAAARWTVANSGTIQSTGTAGYGIDLAARGTVENGVSGATDALISGYGGVLIRGKLAAVANYATIEATGSKRNGVELGNGGRITNGGTGATTALISGGKYAAVIRNAAGTVRNFGTIQGTGGINLVAGGTVVNLGTITGAGGKQAAVRAMAGGRVANGSAASTGALISAFRSGVFISGAAGTVANFGTIDAVDFSVRLTSGGRVTNGSAASTGAQINGERDGVYISGAGGTVSNFGTIGGVALLNGGRITNGSAAATNALISGSVDGDGVLISGGGSGTVSNFGTIEGGQGVFLGGGGRVTNGSATSTSALISGAYGWGVYISGTASTVNNFGTIEGGGYSVRLTSGGRLTNGSAAATNALISGTHEGVYISSDSTVTNFGTIEGGDYSVLLASGGRITNGSAAVTGALISGTHEGVYISSDSTVTNFGTISGGVYSAGGTATNFGTISGGSGGVAVQVRAGVAGKVVVERGAVFIGSVLGGGKSEIDFVAGGVADVGNMSGFATIGLSNGLHHSLTLTGTNFAAVVGPAITVDDGNSGNTVTAATLPAKDHIIVHAGAGLDKLTGDRGKNVFFAGGDTVMTGKAGTNEFTFSAPGGNTVGDFAVSATNEIVFSDQGFNLGLTGASGTPQALPAGLFVENSDGHFTSTSQNFAYATGTGDLFYSASGSSGTPALVSHFTNAPSLAATQLFFIA